MTLLTVTLALLTGCIGSDPSAIYLIRVIYDADAGVECEGQISENFSDGYAPEADEPDDDSEWTYEQSSTGSDTLMFAQVETTAPDQAVLIWGGQVLPGDWDGTTWTFSWADTHGDEERADHESGYRFIESTEESAEVVVSLTFGEGGTASGDITASSNNEMSWRESDEWSNDVEDLIGGSGQIPSSSYLVYEDDGDEFAQQNESDEQECDDDDCELSVATVCSGSNTFGATRTDYSEEDAYAYLQAY
ncbi:MAG: hypothetical protein Q8P18_19250 [Pseudomonadota bacterium]|nr:hypothetical protein [Pseudomonadota bacterium]